MTDRERHAFEYHFQIWFKGNVSAVGMCMLLLEVAHVWDDLVDNDKVVSAETIDRAFRRLLLELPINTFYRANLDVLHPVMCTVWAQWRAANVLEQTASMADREKAFMLRASLYQLFHMCAMVCGGLEWGQEIGPEIYRLYAERLGVTYA